MFGQRVTSVLVLGWMGLQTVVCAAEPKPPALENHRELARLLNIIKTAPQREHRTEARQELDRLDVPLLDVVFALTLDHWLLDSDPVVRYRASRELSEMKSPARVAAVWNLRKLIAAEEDPYLKWMHAVALSSIDPNSGSAFELMNQIPHDDILHHALFVGRSVATTIPRFDNESAISEIPLSKAEYQKLTQMLRLEHLGDPADSPLLVGYDSPAPTRTGSSPPPKTPVYPLIEIREFAEVLRRIEQDLANHDAMKAAALIEAVSRDVSLEHQLELIEQMETPGPYSQEVLKQIRFHKDPWIRSAVLKAFSRAERFDGVLLETLRVSLSDNNPDVRHEAIRAIAQIRKPSLRVQNWLKQLLLSENDPQILSAAASGLKGVSLPREFQQSLFERIDEKKPAEFSLALLECLLDQTAADSEAGKQLSRLKEQLEKLRILQTELYLDREIRWMVQEAEAIKRQANLEAFEQLQKNLILTDD